MSARIVRSFQKHLFEVSMENVTGGKYYKI